MGALLQMPYAVATHTPCPGCPQQCHSPELGFWVVYRERTSFFNGRVRGDYHEDIVWEMAVNLELHQKTHPGGRVGLRVCLWWSCLHHLGWRGCFKPALGVLTCAVSYALGIWAMPGAMADGRVPC